MNTPSQQTILLRQLVNMNAGDHDLLATYRDVLMKQSIYKPGEAQMGGRNEAEIIANGISVPADSSGTMKVLRSLEDSMVNLKSLYDTKRKRLNAIFNLCMFTISFSILLILAGLALLYWNSEEARMGMITTASSILPGFIAATAFLFYDKVKKDAQKLEDNLIQVNNLIIFFKLIEVIPNEEARNKSYGDMIGKMNSFLLRS